MKHLRKFDNSSLYNGTKKTIERPYIALLNKSWISACPRYKYVDLGLTSGTLWCTTNVGANREIECGDYYSWGEFETKSSYMSATYSLWEIDNTMEYDIDIYKYNDFYDTGKIVDFLSVLEPEDDAATVNMGSHWCIPSVEQATELLNETDWEIVENYKNTSVNGILFKSKTNNNTMFIPFSGITTNPYTENNIIIDTGLQDVNLYLYLWLSSTDEENSSMANIIKCSTKPRTNTYVLKIDSEERHRGLNIRPVYK